MDIELTFLDQMIQKTATDLNELLDVDSDKQISKAFTYICMKSVLGMDDQDELLKMLYDNSGDYGIDGLYVSDLGNDILNIKIFQTKYKRLHKKSGKRYDGKANFPANDIVKMLNSIKTIFDPLKELTGVRYELQSKIEEIRSFIADGIVPKIDIYMCNNGIMWNEIAGQEIKNTDLSDWIKFHHINHKDIVNFLRNRENINDKIQFSGKAIVDNFEHKRTLIGKVNVNEFYDLFQKHGDKLLEKNIRNFLGTKSNKVNEAIKKTLINTKDNSDFFFLNNGVTIVVSKFTHNELQEKNYKVNLTDMHIINGGQTCKAIEETIKENPELDTSRAFVLVRIYELSENTEELINKITYATNSQIVVNLRDLKSQDSRQITLSEAVKILETDEKGNPVYTYKIKKGDRSNKNTISITVAAESIISTWRKQPHKVKFRKNRLFDDEQYDIIFTEELNSAQLVLAVLIWRFVETKRKHYSDEYYDKYPFVAYASNHLCMIIGSKILQKKQY